MKSEFSTRLDGIMTAQAEVRSSTMEDKHAELQETVKALKKRNNVLEDKVLTN